MTTCSLNEIVKLSHCNSSGSSSGSVSGSGSGSGSGSSSCKYKRNPVFFTLFMHYLFAMMIAPIKLFTVTLRNRTGEKGRRQTFCDRRDNNFVCKNLPPKSTFF